MWKKILINLLIVCSILNMFIVVRANENTTVFDSALSIDVWDGTTVKKPTSIITKNDIEYIGIYECSELAYVALEGGEWLKQNYVLCTDLYLNEKTPKWDDEGNCINSNELYNWMPIGNSSQPFTGNFYGNGHTIERLYSAGDDLNDRGLFGQISGGNIDGVCIKNSYIANINDYSLSMSGILAGSITSQNKIQNKISNCVIKDSCVKGYRAGGYAGSIGGYYLYLPIIENCFADISVYGIKGNNMYVGGFFGTANCQAYNCFVTGNVSGYRTLGGFAGWNETMNTVFSNCLSTCNVTGEQQNSVLKIGGFIGSNSSATLTNCFFIKTDDVNKDCDESQSYGYAVAKNGELLTSKEIFLCDNAKTILNNWVLERGETYNEWIDKFGIIFLSSPQSKSILYDDKTRIASFVAEIINEKNVCSITTFNVPSTAIVFVASYDGNNRLIDVKRAEFAKGTVYIFFDLSDVYMYKAFIWTENIVPLCESREFIILK